MEIWRQVDGFVNYEVSDKGKVRSLLFNKKRTLKGRLSPAGYKGVALSRDGRVFQKTIHQLVAIAFLNHKPDGHKMVIDHVDGDRLNNKLSNLRIITHRDNVARSMSPKSGHTGVALNNRSNRWTSSLVINGKVRRIGTFDSSLDASRARELALMVVGFMEE